MSGEFIALDCSFLFIYFEINAMIWYAYIDLEKMVIYVCITILVCKIFWFFPH